ncbi:MAG: tRNA (N(6)-L-threonylcarbamoyladenosine(37)-C(2))-methylthiotransferase MtaB [Lachnospiraceae bacterium]|nr:tRNA (N(6)-L-threonylcarbamoyladenosine(37)-C(2))-methylthiotransferase MtaB [Lachnospiraceae bacterium]
MKKRAALHNLGCKVNAYETEAMRQLLEEDGYEIVPFEPGADVYVINTCTVTNIADRKSRQMLHKARKMNPDAIVVAAGCYVETADGGVEKDPAIDIILGNNQKNQLVSVIRDFEQKRAGKRAEEPSGAMTKKIDINHTKEYENLIIDRTENRTRADIKVQDGCNQFCTYCIIPFARGRVRSRDTQDVLQEVRALAASGCQEIVLTGIHLSSYGVDLGEGMDLTALIEAVHEVDGISRIRLGSLEPGIVTEKFAYTLAELPKVCPHFHLSLQSGCDTVLKRMNRRYTSGEFREKCELLREAFTLPALTTDVIVGFPGETEEEFAVTEEFLRQIKLYETHIFKYSKRQGTRAAVMPDQVDEQVKALRSERLIALGEENRLAFEESWMGREAEILFEEKNTIAGKEYFTGYTKEYIRAAVLADRDYANETVRGILTAGPAAHICTVKE